MALVKTNGIVKATMAQLIDAASEVNTMSGVEGQRVQKSDTLLVVCTDHPFDPGVDGTTNEGRVIYHSHGFMHPWTRSGQGQNLVYSAAQERVAQAAVDDYVGADPDIIADLAAKLATTAFDDTADYTTIFPDWNYETGVKHA